MKNLKFLFFIAFFFQFFLAIGQSFDLDRYHFPLVYVQVPQRYIPIDKRTFRTEIISNYPNLNINPNEIYINGFKRVDTGAYLVLRINLNGFINMRPANVQTRIEEVKDNNGKVTKSYTYYRVATAFYIEEGSATLYPTNLNFNLTSSKNFETREYPNQKDAIDNYNLLKEDWKNAFKQELERNVYNILLSGLNIEIGYPILNDQIRLWLLGSKKHPDYQSSQQALEIIQKAFANVSYQQMPEDTKTQVQPAIEIFETQLKNYTEDNRKSRKLRYSAYYNLMKIYMGLEDYKKAAEYAQLLIQNDYDKNDGERMLKHLATIQANLSKAKQTSQHFSIPNETKYVIKTSEY